MALECLCGGGVGSLHLKRDCKESLKKVNAVLPIQRKGGGTKNFINAATLPIPESVFKGMFLNIDSAKRLHGIYDIKNTAFEAQDGTNKDWDDGTSSKISNGNQTFQFVIAETDMGFISEALGLECKNPDVFLHTVDGKIIGYADRDTIAADKKVYPLPVDRWELTNITPTGTDSEVAMVGVTIHFSNSMDYKNWVVINADQHEFDETENYEAQAANLVAGSTPTTLTTIEVVASENGYGILGNSVPITGLAPADFVVNVNGSPEVVTSLSETPSGTYELTFANGVTTDAITVALAPTTGYISQTVTDVLP